MLVSHNLLYFPPVGGSRTLNIYAEDYFSPKSNHLRIFYWGNVGCSKPRNLTGPNSLKKEEKQKSAQMKTLNAKCRNMARGLGVTKGSGSSKQDRNVSRCRDTCRPQPDTFISLLFVFQWAASHNKDLSEAAFGFKPPSVCGPRVCPSIFPAAHPSIHCKFIPEYLIEHQNSSSQ